MVLPIGRPWHAGSNLLDLSDPQSRPVMNNTSSQADRPSTSERYAHQFYVPIAKLPDDDRVAFFIDYCLPARSVPVAMPPTRTRHAPPLLDFPIRPFFSVVQAAL